MAKKVGNKNAGDEQKPKGRQVFDIANSKAMLPVLKDGKPTGEKKLQKAVNDKGLLVAVPVTVKDGDKVVYSGFNPAGHKPLSKKQFASDDVFLDFQALVAEYRGNKLLELAQSRRDRANRLRQFGDAKTRKKAEKLQRMRKQLEELEKQLAEEGVDLASV